MKTSLENEFHFSELLLDTIFRSWQNIHVTLLCASFIHTSELSTCYVEKLQPSDLIYVPRSNVMLISRIYTVTKETTKRKRYIVIS
jgi:hypothetical protein